MSIKINIGRDSLGDVNTDDDNARYVTAVLQAVQDEYQNADVSVELAEHGKCFVKNDETGEIAENVQSISNRVWDDADY